MGDTASFPGWCARPPAGSCRRGRWLTGVGEINAKARSGVWRCGTRAPAPEGPSSPSPPSPSRGARGHPSPFDALSPIPVSNAYIHTDPGGRRIPMLQNLLHASCHGAPENKLSPSLSFSDAVYEYSHLFRVLYRCCSGRIPKHVSEQFRYV
jgi:hypothetical protein